MLTRLIVFESASDERSRRRLSGTAFVEEKTEAVTAIDSKMESGGVTRLMKVHTIATYLQITQAPLYYSRTPRSCSCRTGGSRRMTQFDDAGQVSVRGFSAQQKRDTLSSALVCRNTCINWPQEAIQMHKVGLITFTNFKPFLTLPHMWQGTVQKCWRARAQNFERQTGGFDGSSVERMLRG